MFSSLDVFLLAGIFSTLFGAVLLVQLQLNSMRKRQSYFEFELRESLLSRGNDDMDVI